MPRSYNIPDDAKPDDLGRRAVPSDEPADTEAHGLRHFGLQNADEAEPEGIRGRSETDDEGGPEAAARGKL